MIEGTIANFKNNNGQIKGDDGKLYDFNRRAIKQGNVDDAKPGRRVRFQPEEERAWDVALLDSVVELAKPSPKPNAPSPVAPKSADTATPASQTGQSPRPPSSTRPAAIGTYRFLNPYNFVRPLEVRHPNAALLMGRCTPPPHDRYVGLSGRIKCRLTAVTPVFVSDSHDVREEVVGEKKHRHYRFFRDPYGNVAIPGTSIKGSIRSVFEAVTNSCFVNFAGDKRLSYHLPPGDALKLVPARVREVSKDLWELDLLPGTTVVNPDQRPAGPQYAAWVPTYQPLWASQTAVRASNSPYAGRQKLSLVGWRNGQDCKAVVELVQHPLRRFEFWNVMALARAGQPLPKPQGNQRVVNGILCITNQNIENKHDERLFFSTQHLKPLELPADARKKYEELIADYQERHGDEVRKRKQPAQPQGKEPAFSKFVLERTGKFEAKLVDGDLVYAMLDRKGHGFAVKFIVPVSVPRVGFERTIGELLRIGDVPSAELSKCTGYDHLCPACRTFGWVWSSDDRNAARPPLAEPVAYAGRVRFSHATLKTEHADNTFDATLAILSAPKPTTTRFYLRPRNGNPQNGVPDYQTDYDTDGQILRGRKVYRHHGDRLNPQEYQSANSAKSDQNRTIHGVQKAGSVFEFTVDFENLADVELGALLWSLGMEGWHHRIGLAKPLGFGSVEIEVVEVLTLQPTDRYATLLDKTQGWSIQTGNMQDWISTFKQAMQMRYGSAFEQLANVQDLRSLLRDAPRLPVHYPRPTQRPQTEGKQYEWFVGNKRSGQDAGPRLVLRLADEDHEGLPLIDKYGDRQG